MGDDVFQPQQPAVAYRTGCPVMPDIAEMFADLAGLEPHSPEYRRKQDAIIELCLPIADNIARRFDSRGEPLDDLVQVARAGLVSAVRRFDPEIGSDFLAFAAPTITGAVRRYFRDSTWAIKVPRGLKDLSMQLAPTRAALTQTFGREPSTSELATELGVDKSEADQAIIASCAYRTVPLDSPVNGNGLSIGEGLGSADLKLKQIEDWEILRPLLTELPERERTVLILRYFDSLTQNQIASVIGISQMHVCRLLAKSLERLRSQVQIATGATA